MKVILIGGVRVEIIMDQPFSNYKHLSGIKIFHPPVEDSSPGVVYIVNNSSLDEMRRTLRRAIKTDDIHVLNGLPHLEKVYMLAR